MAGHPAMDDRRLPRLAGARPRAAGGGHEATDAYFAGEDGYADWIADRCEIVAGFWSPSSDLFASWRDYAEKAGLHAGDTKRFREEMERLGFPLKRTKSRNCYVGLRIRQDPPEDDQ